MLVFLYKMYYKMCLTIYQHGRCLYISVCVCVHEYCSAKHTFLLLLLLYDCFTVVRALKRTVHSDRIIWRHRHSHKHMDSRHSDVHLRMRTRETPHTHIVFSTMPNALSDVNTTGA